MRSFTQHAWGEVVSSETRGSVASTQITKTYDYYSNSTIPSSYGAIKSVSTTGGGWEAYEYDATHFGVVACRHRPYLDAPDKVPDPLSGSVLGEVTTYNYDLDAFSQPTRPTWIQTKVDNNITAKTTISYIDTITCVVNNMRVVQATRLDQTGASSSATLQTITKYYREDVTDEFYRSKLHSVQHPDGTKQSFAYQRGSWDGTTFTTSDVGTASRIVVINGTAVAGSNTSLTSFDGYTLDAIYLVDKKSTMQVSIRDAYAHLCRTETKVWDATAATWALVTSEDYTYDLANNMVSRSASNGAISEAVYNGELKVSETDASGITIGYAYDAAGRVLTATKAGGPTTTFGYDAEGRVTSSTISNATLPGETIVSSRSYDDAGRLTSEAHPGPNGAMSTTYAYTPGTRQVTATLPNTGTRIATAFADGSLASVTGTAVVPEYYTYSVDSDGIRYACVKLGTADSTRLRKSWSDWLGRKTKTSRPGFTGQGAFEEQFSYESVTGRLTKATRTGYSNTLFNYDALSQVTLSGLDLNGNDALDLASSDRIAETNQYFDYSDSAWWLVAVTTTYPTAASNASLLVSTNKQRLTGFSGNVRAESISIDVDNNAVHRSTSVVRATKTTTVSTTATGMANTETQTFINGLATSVTRFDGLTYSKTYDAFERPSTSTDPRTGTITTYYKAGSSYVWKVRAPIDVSGNLGYVVAYGYSDAGQVTSVTTVSNSVNKVARTEYNLLGQVMRQWGDTVSPVEYGYNSYGEQTTMSTYRGGTGWTAAAWPTTAAARGVADTTTWVYDGPSGLLTTKTDASANNHTVTYEYNVRGQVSKRTLARGIYTTYEYAPGTGELTDQIYSDSTPRVTYSYKRTGLLNTVTDVTGTRTCVYDTTNPLQLSSVNLPEFYGSRVQTLGYDAVKRPAGFSLGDATRGLQADLSQVYVYDTLGRFDHLTTSPAGQTAREFDYAYNTGGLVSGLTATNSNFSVSRNYEPYRDLLTSIETQWNGVSRTRFDCTYNDLGQRDSAKQSGDVFGDFGNISTYHRYAYTDRGELRDATDYLGENQNSEASPQLSGRHHAYSYDSMGNRSSASRTGTAGIADEFVPNNLNQYSSRTNNYAHVAGTVASSSVSVSIAGPTGSVVSAVGRQGRYWDAQVALANSSGPASGSLSVSATLPGAGAGGADLVGTQSRSVFLPALQQAFTYDADGNMTSDSLWNYSYDAENRLISMTITAVTGIPNQVLEFKYDYAGRRVQKRSYNSTAGTDVYRRYLYDGWNLVAEFNAPSGTSCGSLLRSYTWGLDLVGSLGATGGVGALVQITDHTTNTNYLPTYDANGNVAALLNAVGGGVAAIYEYSPFGELLRCEGGYAKSNPFQFCTKFTDEETGLVYYGHRYYSASLGRFINRDPIEEAGGVNLYGFCGNNPVNRWDVLGNDWASEVEYWTNYYLSLGLSASEASARATTPNPDDASVDYLTAMMSESSTATSNHFNAMNGTASLFEYMDNRQIAGAVNAINGSSIDDAGSIAAQYGVTLNIGAEGITFTSGFTGNSYTSTCSYEAPSSASVDPDAKKGNKYSGSIGDLRKALSANATAKGYLDAFIESGGKIVYGELSKKTKGAFTQGSDGGPGMITIDPTKIRSQLDGVLTLAHELFHSQDPVGLRARYREDVYDREYRATNFEYQIYEQLHGNEVYERMKNWGQQSEAVNYGNISGLYWVYGPGVAQLDPRPRGK